MDIIKAKIEGTEPVVIQQDEVGKVINLMDALRQSVAQSSPQKVKKKAPAASVKAVAAAKKKAKGA